MGGSEELMGCTLAGGPGSPVSRSHCHMIWDLLICPVEGSPVTITWKLFPWAGQIIQRRIFQTCSWAHVPAIGVVGAKLGATDREISSWVLTFNSPFSDSHLPLHHPHIHTSPPHLYPWYLKTLF